MKVIGIIILIFIVGAVYFAIHPEQKSNAQKSAECSTNAGKLYDSERKTITKNANGYTQAEKAYYYKVSSDGFTRNLNNCRQLYGQ
jgi:hypothetical protein